jgi:hypothetical protein
MAIFSPTSSSRLTFLNSGPSQSLSAGFHLPGVTEQLLVLLEADERVLTAGGFTSFQLDFVNLTAREVA